MVMVKNVKQKRKEPEQRKSKVSKSLFEQLKEQRKKYPLSMLFWNGLISLTNYVAILAVVLLFLFSLNGLTDDHDEALDTLLMIYGQVNGELDMVDLEDAELSEEVSGLMDINAKQVKSLFTKFLLIFSGSFFLLFFINAINHFFMWGRAHSLSYKELISSLFSSLFLVYLIFNFIFLLLFILLLALNILFLPTVVAAVVGVLLYFLYWYYAMFLRYRFFSTYILYKEVSFTTVFVLLFSSFKLGFVHSFKILKVLAALVGFFILSVLAFSFLTYLLPDIFVAVVSLFYLLFFLVFARNFYVHSLKRLQLPE